ncbi:protein of unknown function DUF45 [Magnetococcus marinus MC-1]|uniref:YgjP-like metallopeptidase domain-containing protein n=1 Tax=Magnetococcus marinus (strain ATCC BAA-1437 / JCM 17883 / MC-1) TaxID=156889 RepID=A0LD06_MAGMM|nr:SprT family zinc-dependent metalloprotease [Magnetococcus marinus]ABK45849.1 protein of unknown function DUF45 [Magnetococcus marinus MC-1]
MEHQQQLVWQQWQVPVHYRRSSRARHLRITIGQQAVRVSMPPGVSLQEAQAFVQRKEAWIGQHWSRNQHQAPPRLSGLTDGMTVMLWAEPVSLVWQPATEARVILARHQQQLHAWVPAAWSDAVAQQALQTALKRYLSQTLLDALHGWLPRYSQPYALHPTGMRVRLMRSRWGSCGVRGTLNFNRHLVHAPPAVAEYVLVHELAHLRHRNHGPRFWQLVAEMDPLYGEHRHWLRSHGQGLGLKIGDLLL